MLSTILETALLLNTTNIATQTVVIPLPTTIPGQSSGLQYLAPANGEGRARVILETASNPYGRTIDLTVNVQFYKKELGESLMHMTKEGAVSFNAEELTNAIKQILTEAGRAKLDSAVAGRRNITIEDLKAVGIEANFDRENVSLAITSIDPSLRSLEALYHEHTDEADKKIDASPAEFSFFTDASFSESRLWNGARADAGLRHPSTFFNSAARLGGVVLEASGQFADRNPELAKKNFGFDRNFVRLVYDLPKLYLRTYLGDLTPETRFQQNFVQMGGIGVSRQKRRFDAFRSAVLQGNRQLLLQRESTVEVYRNGILFQQIQLPPGAYDLSNLPLLSGSNDIRLSVTDGSGLAQSLDYKSYLDPIDLEPGDYEFGAYLGKISTKFGLSPKYDGEAAFSGFYRKSFLQHPAIGVGLQASQSVQQLSGQTQFLIGPGRLDVTGAASHSKVGSGYFAGFAYDLALDQGQKSTFVSLQATLQSRYFTALGSPFQINSGIANASLTMGRTLSSRLSVQGGATYNHNRSGLNDSYRIFADAYYQLSRRWFVRGGIDYQHFGLTGLSQRQNGPGFNFAIAFRPSSSDRAEARYNYHFDDAQLSYEHSPDGYVGSLGYGALLGRSGSQSLVQGYGNYTGNRFSAALTHSLSGTGIGQITNRQITTARLSTAFAFADGAFAITRRVGDSFAILTPHPSLKQHPIIIGQLLTDPRYRSRSGALGGAVQGSLSSYVTQSVEYDVEDPPAGYDVGLGVIRVRPPYHSGYHLVVGTDAFVTATGTLLDQFGKPASLVVAQVIDLSKNGTPPSTFFTNSAGRFAILGLRPSDNYRVQLSSGGSFDFVIPADTKGLVDLHSVTLHSKN